MQSRAQQPCKFIGTKRRVYIRKLLNSGLVWYTNMAAVSFVWNTNIAAVTSCAYAKWGCCETKTKEMTLSNKRDPDTLLNELKLQPNT